MRFLTRLHVLGAVTIIAILYFGWVLPSLHIKTRIQKAWTGSSHQLVVFGDDWSDTGEYRVSPPPKAEMPQRDIDRGQLWTEVLCKELICDYIDNFARSLPPNDRGDSLGSMVDNDVYANATTEKSNSSAPLYDFKTQVQQWTNFEKQKRLMPGRQDKGEWTVFTVLFGVWDLWEYSTFEKSRAAHAIDRSIEELFHNLDIVAEHAQQPVKIVIPHLMDLSFLPRFQNKKRESTSQFAQDQHMAVFLWTYWNTALSQSASRWTGGDIFMPDINEIVVNRMRGKQLYSKHISDATGAGKQVPLFDDVKSPCVPTESGATDGGEMHAAGAQICDEPGRRLFWDDMRLGGTAHKLIGREAARLIDGNTTVNMDARQSAKTASGTSQKGGHGGSNDFGMHLPPGM